MNFVLVLVLLFIIINLNHRTTQTQIFSTTTTTIQTETTTTMTSTTPAELPTTRWVPYNYTLCNYGYYINGYTCYDCGLTYSQPNVKIIGGIEAIPHSFPSLVLVAIYAINFEGKRKIYTICGGTLINRQTVLTAAHCILEIQFYSTEFVVYYGVHNISSVLHNSSIQDQLPNGLVVNAIKHPDYNDETLQNDIALLILKNPIIPNSFVNIACLPESSKEFPPLNDTTYTAGWGVQIEYGSFHDLSDTLYNINFTVYDPSYCSSVYADTPKDWNSQFCAGYWEGGKDTCQGDSGSGVLVSRIIDGVEKYLVAGVVSYGFGCAEAYTPGIYTRVSYYIEWIVNNWVVPKDNRCKKRK